MQAQSTSLQPGNTNTTVTGRLRPQAPRAQPQGQGRQVPSDSHRVAYPPSGPLLQDRRRPAADLEVRERYGQHHRCLNDSKKEKKNGGTRETEAREGKETKKSRRKEEERLPEKGDKKQIKF